MNKYSQKIKDLFKKRVVILGTVFVFLFFVWYMTVPIKIKNCDIGNNHYAHKFFNMCSDKVVPNYDNDDEYYSYRILADKIVHQSNPDIKYSINNIAGHISILRAQSNHNNILISWPDSDWINLLITLGHYDEAIEYIKFYPQEKLENFSVLNSLVKESCYSSEFLGSTRRIGILGCKIASPIITLQKKKEILLREDSVEEYNNTWNKKVVDARNDIIDENRIVKYPSKEVQNANDLINSKQYDLAYKTINEYALKEKNLKFNLLQYDFHNSYLMELYFKLGIAYINKQEYKKAIECFENILKIQDYNYKAHEKLEICYRKLGNTQKADEHARIMKELLAL